MRFRWLADPLAWTALTTMLLVLFRAATQHITIDEAMTYLMFTSRSPEFLWWPASNNHLLNSLLSYPFVRGLGPSEFTVRSAAMMGMALYLTAAYRLSNHYSPQSLRWTVLLCLSANPMLLDYLVAGRGYGLATGLLMWSFVFLAEQPWTLRRAMLCSLCAGLSTIANFAFALISASTLAAAFFFPPRTSLPRRRLAAALLLPALVPLLVAAPTLIRWPRGQLFFGARSFSEMFVTLLDGSLHKLPLAAGSPYIGLAIVAMCITLAAIHAVTLWRAGAQHSTPLFLSRTLAAIAVAALTAHWFLFRATGILLPKERTALYLVPVVTLILAGVASTPLMRRTMAQRALTLAFAALAGHYLLSLRWSYFHQWEWDADTRSLYQETVRLTESGCPRTVVSDWRFATCLQFYQKIRSTEPVFPIISYESGPSPVQDAIFILHPVHNRRILQTANLQVLYRAPRSEAVIAAPANACRP